MLTTSSLTNSVLAMWRSGLIQIDVDGAEFDALQSGRDEIMTISIVIFKRVAAMGFTMAPAVIDQLFAD
jgi:hypothetical protein